MTTRAEQAEAKAIARVAAMTTRQLVDTYDLARAQQHGLGDDEASLAVYQSISTTLGWIQDELERRDLAAFAAWMESAEWHGSPSRFFLSGEGL